MEMRPSRDIYYVKVGDITVLVVVESEEVLSLWSGEILGFYLVDPYVERRSRLIPDEVGKAILILE